MKLKVVDYDNKKVIALSGEIDMYSSPQLRQELLNLIKAKTPRLIIDLKGVSYIDSSGIATFVEGLKGMKSYGGRLQFSEIPKAIMDIFSFSKLDRVFEIYENIDEALKS